MEMEDMKTAWTKMDEILRKQEIFSEKLVKEMLRDRSHRSVSKLINYEMFVAVCMLVSTPALIIFVLYNGHRMPHLVNSLILFWSLICLLTLIWQIIKIKKLLRLDVANNVKDNMRHINRYKLYIQREKTGMWILWPVAIMWLIAFYALVSAPLAAWIFMVCVVLGSILLTVYFYKKLYDKHIASIRRSLDELKDIEEE